MQIFPRQPFSGTVLRMALPALAGLSTQMVLSMVDAAFVGRLANAEQALAAMGLGVLATWAVVSFFSSLATGTHILVARKWGEHNNSAINRVLVNSVYVGLAGGVLVLLFSVLLSHSISQLLAKDYTVGVLAGDFIFYRFLGLPFFLVSVSFRGFYFGIGNTRIFMVSGIFANAANIFFNYIFIYGKLGMPEMGVAGSGLGSSLATVCEAAVYLAVSWMPKYRKGMGIWSSMLPDFTLIRQIYRLSLPVSFQNIFVLLGFLLFIAITGLIGVREQAATQAIISSLFLSVLPCFAFGIAVQTLSGNNLGKGKIALSKVYTIEAAKIATIYTLSMGFVYVVLPEYLLTLITNEQRIIETAIPAMRIAGFAQIFYATGIVLANGLQSFGKTTYVMLAEGISNLMVFVPLSYLLGIWAGLGYLGAWAALPVYIISYTAAIILKFNAGSRHTIRHF